MSVTGREGQEDRKRALDQIAHEVSVCTRCPLHVGRTNSVPGEGQSETEVVFVGEGPGFNEDQQGRPFVGAAGGLLNELLKAIGWRREEVFITNVVKCRPPQNRDPEPNEIAACAPYLKRQLEVLDPALVVTLGRYSLQTFMPGARISSAHGTVKPVDPETGAANAVAYAMYHPAAALRAGSLKQTMLEDMAGIPQVLIDSRARRAPAPVEIAPVQTAPIQVAPAEIAPPDVMPQPSAPPISLEPDPAVDEVLAAMAIAADSPPEAVDENQMSLF
jgi:uracil-DNA glycosylase family 4